jgi:multiple sugar transport system substrate-binding protein
MEVGYMRKFITMVLVTSMVLTTTLFANGSKEVASASTKGTEINVGLWGGNDVEASSFDKMAAAFTKKTGITVAKRVYSDFNTEIQAEFIGDNGPDVFYLDASMAPFYVQQEVVEPLDYAEYDLDQFYAPIRDAFKFDGKYYAVSKDFSTLAVYYNKAYISEDEIPDTFEGLYSEAFLNKIQARLPEGAIALSYNQDLARQMYVAQNGNASITKGVYSNLADPAVESNLNLIYNVAKKGLIKTPAELGVGWNGDAFGNGKCAIMIEGNWVLGFLQTNFPAIDFGIKEVPAFKGDKATMVFTVGYAINKETKVKAASVEFIKFATGTEGMAIWTKDTGVLPSRKDVAEALDVASNPFLAPHLAGGSYATPWQVGTTLDTINSEFMNYIPSVISGERTLHSALQKAQDEANSTIDADLN